MDSGITLLDNVLTSSGWTLNNCTISNGNFVFSAAGHASIEFAGDLPGYTPPRAYIDIAGSNLTGVACRFKAHYDDNRYQTIYVPVHPAESDYYVAMDNGTDLVTLEIRVVGETGSVVKVPMFRPESTYEADMDGNAVQLATNYYGVKITKTAGLEIARDDDNAEMVLNTDVFRMSAKENGIMVDQLYFDPITKKFVFNGTLSANLINALSALITPNLYASKATIAELTVDEFDTSDKADLYLSESEADDNFIKAFGKTIQFITATNTGGEVQAGDRYDRPLYWTDATHTAASTDVTAFPVMNYTYDEAIKLSISFEAHGVDSQGKTLYIPVINLGAGDTNGYSKGKIYKGATGLYIEYLSSSGNTRSIRLTDDGIDLSDFESIIYKENVTVLNVPQIWVKPEMPTYSKVNDVFLDSNDYSMYDVNTTTITTLDVTIDSEEVIVITTTGGATVNLFTPQYPGIIRKIYNVTSTASVRINWTSIYSENKYIYLFPGESVEMISDGTSWRY